LLFTHIQSAIKSIVEFWTFQSIKAEPEIKMSGQAYSNLFTQVMRFSKSRYVTAQSW